MSSNNPHHLYIFIDYLLYTHDVTHECEYKDVKSSREMHLTQHAGHAVQLAANATAHASRRDTMAGASKWSLASSLVMNPCPLAVLESFSAARGCLRALGPRLRTSWSWHHNLSRGAWRSPRGRPRPPFRVCKTVHGRLQRAVDANPDWVSLSPIYGGLFASHLPLMACSKLSKAL